MDFSQFNEEVNYVSTMSKAKNAKHANTDNLIQPWVNNSIFNHIASSFKKKESNITVEKVLTERKKTTDERIQQIYRKYSKQDFVRNRQNNRANSRQIYREMLKQFQKAQEFKQIGPKMQQLDSEIQSFSLELLRKKASLIAYTCPYDYKQITMKEIVIGGQQKIVNKCSEKFQKMMKIRERIRRKNNLTVSKQKQKYLSEYNPILIYTQREQISASAGVDQQKAKIRIKNMKLNCKAGEKYNSMRGKNYSVFGNSMTKRQNNKEKNQISKTRPQDTIYSFRE